MNNKKSILGIILVVIVLGVIIIKPSHKKSDMIEVGVIAPLTGSGAVYGTEAANAALLAIDTINAAGGIAGKKIHATVEDGKCDPKVALDAFQKLVSGQDVKVLFAGHCSTETVTVAPLAEKNKVLVLANMTSAPKIAGEGEWVFRNSPVNTYIAANVAGYAVSKGYKKIAMITELKDFPKTYSESFKDALTKAGGALVFDEQFVPDTKDFRTIITKLKATTFDAVVVATQGAETMGLVVKQMKDLGIEKPTIFNPAFSAKKFLDTTGGYLPKTYIIINGYANPETPSTKAFIDAYKTKYGKDIAFNLYYVAAVYDMVFRFKDAVVACANNADDIECIRNVFKNATGFSGVSGTISIGSTYAPKSAIMPLSRYEVKDGKEVPVSL
jgi:branched-chain amino acid transport system substrate-binding protein